MKPKCEESLSNFAIKCNLRHYNWECFRNEGAVQGGFIWDWVGRCRLTPGFHS